jgi:hypothetical protein
VRGLSGFAGGLLGNSNAVRVISYCQDLEGGASGMGDLPAVAFGEGWVLPM